MDRLSDLLDTPKSSEHVLAELYPPTGAAGQSDQLPEPPDEALRSLVQSLATSDWSAESAIREQLRRSLIAKSRPDHPSITRFASLLGGAALAWMLLVLFLSAPHGNLAGQAAGRPATPTEVPTVTVAGTNDLPTATAPTIAPSPRGSPSPIATGQILFGPMPTLTR